MEIGFIGLGRMGANKATFDYVEPILKTLAPPDGYLLCGPVGAGHLVKMVHNGIEYGMLQAYGEGFEILNASREYNLDLHAIAHLRSSPPCAMSSVDMQSNQAKSSKMPV